MEGTHLQLVCFINKEDRHLLGWQVNGLSIRLWLFCLGGYSRFSKRCRRRVAFALEPSKARRLSCRWRMTQIRRCPLRFRPILKS